jgi:hypothetical protein
MNKMSAFAIGAVFIIFGTLYLLSLNHRAEVGIDACAARCKYEGKDFAYSPSTGGSRTGSGENITKISNSPVRQNIDCLTM